eukprot:Lithocolla_globosa_v1_NODE_6936_length_1013_cov_2.923800.p1 type:complete len:103 gc:universal NODE_6936_length_1013_cov_2.923800:921-613(-)
MCFVISACTTSTRQIRTFGRLTFLHLPVTVGFLFHFLAMPMHHITEPKTNHWVNPNEPHSAVQKQLLQPIVDRHSAELTNDGSVASSVFPTRQKKKLESPFG